MAKSNGITLGQAWEILRRNGIREMGQRDSAHSLAFPAAARIAELEAENAKYKAALETAERASWNAAIAAFAKHCYDEALQSDWQESAKLIDTADEIKRKLTK